MARWNVQGVLRRVSYTNINEDVTVETDYEEHVIQAAIEQNEQTPYDTDTDWADGPFVAGAPKTIENEKLLAWVAGIPDAELDLIVRALRTHGSEFGSQAARDLADLIPLWTKRRKTMTKTPTQRIPLIIYHAGCRDGFTSAWVASTYFGHGKCELMKAQYHDKPVTEADVTGRDVYILDFSYPKEILEKLKPHTRQLLVFDHHESVDQEAKDLPYFTFDNSRSGASLTWDFFYEGRFRPRLVNYVEDRDLWNWKMEHSLEVNTWINSWDFELEIWDQLHDRLEEDFQSVVQEGTAQVRLQDRLVKSAVGGATGMDLAGFRVPSVNSCLLQSEIGNVLCQGKPFAAVWYEKRGKRIYSLRSSDAGEDVAVIAKARGGGGHRNAAGFAVDIEEEE